MKCYRITVSDADGVLVGWERSIGAALTRAQVMIKEECQGEGSLMGIDEQEIPTDKAGLLFWLNQNMTRDNG